MDERQLARLIEQHIDYDALGRGDETSSTYSSRS